MDQIVEISEMLDKQGKGLKDCAKQDPGWFYSNFLKGLIPKNVDVKLDGDLTIRWEP